MFYYIKQHVKTFDFQTMHLIIIITVIPKDKPINVDKFWESGSTVVYSGEYSDLLALLKARTKKAMG